MPYILDTSQQGSYISTCWTLEMLKYLASADRFHCIRCFFLLKINAIGRCAKLEQSMTCLNSLSYLNLESYISTFWTSINIKSYLMISLIVWTMVNIGQICSLLNCYQKKNNRKPVFYQASEQYFNTQCSHVVIWLSRQRFKHKIFFL